MYEMACIRWNEAKTETTVSQVDVVAGELDSLVDERIDVGCLDLGVCRELVEADIRPSEISRLQRGQHRMTYHQQE